MEGEEKDEEEEEGKVMEGGTGQDATTTYKGEETEQEGVEISFHALRGGTTGKIIKVPGKWGERKLLVLIDSGSTHSFLNEATALELGCKMMATTPLSVTMANGSKMYSHNKCEL